MKPRRVVTGLDDRGKSIIVHDGIPPRTKDFVHTPGFTMSLAWATMRSSKDKAADITERVSSVVPGPGETSVHIVTFPPDSIFASPHFNVTASLQEHAEQAPGLVQFFERDNPGMHKTPTIDYAFVLDGEIWLEVDDGKIVHLKQHDFVVQNGTRHAWRNKGERPAILAFVLIGQDAGAPR